MGVFIHPCKIKEKVCGLVNNEEMDALYEKYDDLNEDILVLENTSKYDDFISPFEEGVYTYDGGQTHIGISYSTYGDFLQRLEVWQMLLMTFTHSLQQSPQAVLITAFLIKLLRKCLESSSRWKQKPRSIL